MKYENYFVHALYFFGIGCHCGRWKIHSWCQGECCWGRWARPFSWTWLLQQNLNWASMSGCGQGWLRVEDLRLWDAREVSSSGMHGDLPGRGHVYTRTWVVACGSPLGMMGCTGAKYPLPVALNSLESCVFCARLFTWKDTCRRVRRGLGSWGVLMPVNVKAEVQRTVLKVIVSGKLRLGSNPTGQAERSSVSFWWQVCDCSEESYGYGWWLGVFGL